MLMHPFETVIVAVQPTKERRRKNKHSKFLKCCFLGEKERKALQFDNIFDTQKEINVSNSKEGRNFFVSYNSEFSV